MTNSIPESSSNKKPILAPISSVFFISLIICVMIVAYGIINPDRLADSFINATSYILDAFDWLFMLSVTFFIVFSLLLALSDYGKLKLGKPEDEPEFGLISWLSMLFAAGMGAGLLFWGVIVSLITALLFVLFIAMLFAIFRKKL